MEDFVFFCHSPLDWSTCVTVCGTPSKASNRLRVINLPAYPFKKDNTSPNSVVMLLWDADLEHLALWLRRSFRRLLLHLWLQLKNLINYLISYESWRGKMFCTYCHLCLVTPFLNIWYLLLDSFTVNWLASIRFWTPARGPAAYISLSINSNRPSTAMTASVLSCFSSTGPICL